MPGTILCNILSTDQMLRLFHLRRWPEEEAYKLRGTSLNVFSVGEYFQRRSSYKAS